MKYKFIKDYKVAGKKVGDPIELKEVPHYLKAYLAPADKVVAETGEGEKVAEAYPDETWLKDEIIGWLADNGVDAKGTKDELLKEVKKVLKAK